MASASNPPAPLLVVTGALVALATLSLPSCLDWDLPQAPRISSVTKASCAGGKVTIKGCRFGEQRAKSAVSISGQAATEFLSWKDNEIQVTVPPKASSGEVSVMVDGLTSNPHQIKLAGIARLADIHERLSFIRDSKGKYHFFYYTPDKALIHRQQASVPGCWADPPNTLLSGAFYHYRPAVGPAGRIHLGYDDGSSSCYYLGYNLTTPGVKPATWSKEVVIGTGRCSMGSMTVDHKGRLHAFWSGILAECVIQDYDELAGSWDKTRHVMYGWYIQSAASPDGTLHAATHSGGPLDPSSVKYSRSMDGGANWSAEKTLSMSLGAASPPGVVVTADGRVHFSFGGKKTDGTCDIYYTGSKDSGKTWSSLQNISNTKGSTWMCGSWMIGDPKSHRLALVWRDDFLKTPFLFFRRWYKDSFSETTELLSSADEKKYYFISPGMVGDRLEYGLIHKTTGELTRGQIDMAKHPEMVFVPGGSGKMGSPKGTGNADEFPEHVVQLSPFYIDRNEISVAEFRKCVTANKCTPPREYTSHSQGKYWNAPKGEYNGYPVIYVSWNQADAYCKWAGKRLPTEAEWERAARGYWNGKYPWGNTKPGCSTANFYGSPGGVDMPCTGDTSKVGGYPAGASLTGALDLGGNVAEWVADWYAKDYYKSSPKVDPQGPTKATGKVYRGGSFRNHELDLRSSFRSFALPDKASNDIGFRCAVSAK